MKKYKILCYWPSEQWVVLEEGKYHGYVCKAKGKEGYEEAKQWLKDNDK